MRRILLIGAYGQLGTAIRSASADEIVAPLHEAFDIVTDDADALLDTVQPQAVVNCAAFHNVDACERDPVTAFATNALAVERLAVACARREITFVTISSDYVFDGTLGRPYREDDAALPRTIYGISKVAGEFAARRHGERAIVVRTSGVFGTTGTSNKGYTLIDKVLGQAERGEPTRMVADLTFSPSYAPHVAQAIGELIDRAAFGVHHVTNSGACSWYEFVRTAFDKAGLADAPLEPVDYASFGNPTQRPRYSALENTSFAGVEIAPMPSWRDALDEFLAVRRARLAVAATAQK